MDVEVALTHLRAISADIHAAEESEERRDKAWCEAQATRASELADAAMALDDWLSKGGHPPAAWTKPGTAVPDRVACRVCGAAVGYVRGIGRVFPCLHGTHRANAGLLRGVWS